MKLPGMHDLFDYIELFFSY